MKINRIAKIGNEDKFGVFIDNKLRLILDGKTILETNLRLNQSISDQELKKIEELKKNNEFYLKAIKYLSHRQKTENELKDYLKKKGAPEEQIKSILNRFKEMDLINDQRYVQSFIHDKLNLNYASRKKISYLLRAKKIAEEIIKQSLENEQISDHQTLKKLIQIKKSNPKLQDNLKLTQYLVRVGFNYSDVLEALKEITAED
jgi:regulatory protein